jgi:hypothetical protein
MRKRERDDTRDRSRAAVAGPTHPRAQATDSFSEQLQAVGRHIIEQGQQLTPEQLSDRQSTDPAQQLIDAANRAANIERTTQPTSTPADAFELDDAAVLIRAYLSGLPFEQSHYTANEAFRLSRKVDVLADRMQQEPTPPFPRYADTPVAVAVQALLGLADDLPDDYHIPTLITLIQRLVKQAEQLRRAHNTTIIEQAGR